MEIFGNSSEVCRYTRKTYGRLLTVRDINSLRLRFRLMGDRKDVVGVKDLLRGQGTLRLLMRKDVAMFAVFVLDRIWPLARIYRDVLLADFTYLIKCGGIYFGIQ